MTDVLGDYDGDYEPQEVSGKNRCPQRVALTDEGYNEFLRIVKRGIENVIREHFTE